MMPIPWGLLSSSVLWEITVVMPFALQNRYKILSRVCLTILALQGGMTLVAWPTGDLVPVLHFVPDPVLIFLNWYAGIMIFLFCLTLIWEPFGNRTRTKLLSLFAGSAVILLCAEIFIADRITDHERVGTFFRMDNAFYRYFPVGWFAAGVLLFAGAKQQGRPVVRRISLSVLAILITAGQCCWLSWDLSDKLLIYYDTLPVAVGILLSLILLLFIWRVFRPTARAAAACALVLLLALSVALSRYSQRYHDGLETISDETFYLMEYEPDPTLAGWEPFGEGSRAAVLDDPSSLTFSESLPVMDGATALYPLYAAFAQAVYPEGDYSGCRMPVACTRTGPAFTGLVEGKSDIVFLMGVSEQQRQQARDAGVTIRETPIGREAFVFIINALNPVYGLTVQQIKDIYSGKISNWADAGGNNSRIRPPLRAP